MEADLALHHGQGFDRSDFEDNSRPALASLRHRPIIPSTSYHHPLSVSLYQSVHRVGGLHPTLRHARSEILHLLDSVVRLPNGDLWGFIALPSFLAAGLSLSDTDRTRSMKHMTRTGPERVWLDNRALIEKLWEETDQTGKLTDWHDKMTREGMSVAFF
jgi:hypothetical protein